MGTSREDLAGKVTGAGRYIVIRIPEEKVTLDAN